MKISKQKITWMSVSCILAMLAGFPAVADDTELLLANPDPSTRPKANVLFILDTSGSMQTEQETTEPYDSSVSYSGDCNVAQYYWTTNPDVKPVCDGSNNRIIDDGKMVCDAAARLINGIGSYTDTLVQFRDKDNAGIGPGPKRWQTIAPGFTGEFVECAGDSGLHGDGLDTTRLYAASGNNITPFWTSNPNKEISWGSGYSKTQYTIYKGNYLNWKENPNTVTWRRTEIMISVASTVLNSVSNLNVGLMRYNFDAGGPVVQDIVDIDIEANRQAVIAAVQALPASGYTPLSETLYEAALYWRGMSAHYGENVDELPTDPGALFSVAPEVYERPEFDVCAKNYNVLLTDGQPVRDLDTPDLMVNLPGQGGTCDGADDEGYCLDDVAEYLFTHDVNPSTEEMDVVSTHTIGFAVDLPILQETATDSGGQYFLAEDVESLTKTMLQIIANITDLSTSFAAPAVSVNSFNRTQNLNDLYVTTFDAKSKIHWPGNLKKYRIAAGAVVDVNGDPAVDPQTGFFSDTATSYWTTGGPDGNSVTRGGVAQQLPDPLVRNLYTDKNGNDLTAGANQISSSNAGSFVNADFGLTGAAGEPSMDELIRWARGEDTQDVDNNPATLVRKAMGDPLHAQPAAIVYGGTAQNPEVVVFTATNDGYLHAVSGDTGVELWSYIPGETLSDLTDLYFDSNASYKHYGLDGNVVPIVKDVDDDGIVEPADGDFVQLLFGMRRGGNTTFALDVTNKNSPQLLWKVNQPASGQSWSTPVVARVDIGNRTQNADNAVVVMGGGYDVVHDTSAHPAAADAVGASVHMFDLRTGAELWNASSANVSDLTVANMTRSIPTQIRVVDLGGDGLADRMYATDMGGQVWRFDIFNGENANKLVTGGVIARFGAETIANPTIAETRRFYNAPDISLITDPHQQRRYVAVSVGSGYRVHPFDLDAADRFYSLRDGDVFNQLTQAMYDSYPIATDADLVEVSGQTQTVVTANDRGWKFTLPANQKVLADSLTFADEIFFVAFSPDTTGEIGCTAAAGTNFLYRMNAINGDPVVTNIEALIPALSDDERRSTLAQGGIAPSPAILFPSPDDANCTGEACSPPPIYCVGLECASPGFENNPVRTLWTQDGIE